MRKLEFVLIFFLVLVICAMASFTRWHISFDAEWNNIKASTTNAQSSSIPDEGESNSCYEPAVSTNGEINDYLLSLPMTRMGFFIKLCDAVGIEQEYGPVGFTDIEQESVNASYIYPLVKRGLLVGYPDNTLRHNEFITIQEAETIMTRILSKSQEATQNEGPLLTQKDMLNVFSSLQDKQ